MTIVTHSLEESAAQICGADEHGNPLPGKVQWLSLQLRNGKLPGYKSGRKWRMTDEHIAEAIKALEPQRMSIPDIPGVQGMTPTSRRRLAG